MARTGIISRITSALDDARGRLTNAAYANSNRNRGLSLISDWLAGMLWIIETRFLPMAQQAYGQNEVVYACLRVLSQSVPEPPLVAYVGEDKSRKPLPKEHPLMKLLQHPNPLMTSYEMIELATLHLLIIGRSTWWKERDNAGRVIALWPMRPDRVGPIYAGQANEIGGTNIIWGWSYQEPGTGIFVPVPARDVLMTNWADLAGESGGMIEGFGPCMALARQISADNEATKFVGALLANYAAPTVALKIKQPIRSEAEAKLIKQKFAQEFGGDRRGTPAVIDADAEIQVIGFNLQELEFPNLRDLAETRIAAAFGVPPALVGLHVGLKEMNQRASVDGMRRWFAETTLANYWRRYQDVFTRDLASEFGDGITIEFDTAKVKALSMVYVEQAQPTLDAFKVGVATVNEYRQALGWDPFEPAVGEVFYIPTTVTVVPATPAARDALRKLQEAAQPQPAALPAGQERLALPSGENGEEKPPNGVTQREPSKLNGKNGAAKALPVIAGGAATKSALDPRDMAERKLQEALIVLFRKVAKDVADKIASGEPVTDEELTSALARTIEPQLVEAATAEGIRVAAEVGVEFDPAAVNVAAVEWARNYTFDLVRDLTDTTRTLLQNAVSKYHETPGMTMGELHDSLSPAFGAARAQAISVTEVTRAFSQGQNTTQQQLAQSGITMERIWRTNADELVCEICEPLNGEGEDVWSGEYPDGPPAHVNCRCALSLRHASSQ